MISREDARAIVYALDPSRLVRMAYRAASSGAALAVVMLDLPNLRAVRERAGMTRKELEEIVGISRFRLHLVEEGERRVKARTARKIAAALGTMVEGLSEGSCEGAARRTTATKPSTKGAA